VAISDNGDYLMASSADKRIYVFDRSGSLIWNPRNTDHAFSMDMSISARTMVVGMGNEVHMLTREGSVLRRWQGHDRIHDVAISANGEYTAAVSADHSIYYFDRDCELLWSHKTLGAVNCVAISSAGDFIAAGGHDRTIYYFDNNLYFKNFMAQATKTLESVKGFGANLLEAEVLMQRAESEFSRKEYASALNYARGAEKVALRLKEKCRPDLSILAVAAESFNLEAQTKLNMILMNSGTANATNLRLEWAGQVAIEGNMKVPSLPVSKFVSETYGIRPLATGTLGMKLCVFFSDNDGKEYVAEAVFSIVAAEAGKKVAFGKTQPIIQLGNIGRLVAKVQAAKKDAPPKPAAPAGAAPKAPVAGPAPGTFVADARCPACGKGVRMDWPSCPYCHTKFRA
jgi:outer membrane protein assembly factor BamB